MADDDLRKADRRERLDEFGAAGQGRIAVYQGNQPVVPEVVAGEKPSPLARANTSRRAMKAWGLTRNEAKFFLAIPETMSLVEAWRKAFPNDKTSPTNQRHKASRYRRLIIAKMGDEEMLELNGLGHQAFMEKLRQMLNAKVRPQFFDTKRGTNVDGNIREDNRTQMEAVKLLGNVLGYSKDEKGGGGQVIVNVIQYAPQGAPPWPGGGRS